MQNIITVLVTALMSSGFSVGSAQTKPNTPATPAAPASIDKKAESDKAQATVLTGKVTSVNAKAGKITVKTHDKEISLTTDSKSTKAALEKLKVGDMAKIFAKGGNVIAASPVKDDSKTKAPK